MAFQQRHTVNPLHDWGDTALRLRGPHSHHPCGFPGLPALGGPPMSGVVSCDQSEGLARIDKDNRSQSSNIETGGPKRKIRN
jgi:hypothetical protein